MCVQKACTQIVHVHWLMLACVKCARTHAHTYETNDVGTCRWRERLKWQAALNLWRASLSYIVWHENAPGPERGRKYKCWLTCAGGGIQDFFLSLSLSGKLSSLSVKTRCQTQNRASFETITGQDKGESVPNTWAFVGREHGRQASFDDEEKKCFCSQSTIKHLGVSMARQTSTIFPPPEILKTCTARI